MTVVSEAALLLAEFPSWDYYPGNDHSTRRLGANETYLQRSSTAVFCRGLRLATQCTPSGLQHTLGWLEKVRSVFIPTHHHLYQRTVDHPISLSILPERFAVADTALSWFSSYLADRTQRVRWELYTQFHSGL